MKDYTIVLQRPDYLREEDIDVYVALVSASDQFSAVTVAQEEASAADGGGAQADDYALAVSFNGHCNPVLWGWML